MKSHIRYGPADLRAAPFPTEWMQLRDAIGAILEGSSKDIDILHWATRTALELIGQSGLGKCRVVVPYNFLSCSDLGYSFDNLNEGPPNKCSTAVKSLVLVISLATRSSPAISIFIRLIDRP
jgi:hypothetical protein